ncbi:MFS general substrate transporter [Laetiporus sulphureus 93-53]|uniref:MFS general substrate transporter n=1 Tax=Laetiporus sulphureus 93-53 TaxID=1314785 RepID=A0A165BSM5_9APHY|nr:MFS general substrate transporter [Laetiporus sulphureus 93-53]KZT01574.1 MFS general substrate transporter [Laetiporus sulphureus 93-53]
MTGFGAIPLAEEGAEDNDDSHLTGVARILGPRWLQLPALTVGLLGVQVFWSIEMSYGTPYLISLGLSKSAVATVFLAGPLSGLVVQPLIGVLADNSKSRFGRRRPYMLAGTCICVTAMLLLGFTRPFATLFTPSGSIANRLLTIWLAIVALFAVDFSINAVQAVDRALLVDTLPPSDQAEGNAWAARMLGIGSVAGYFIGNVDLTTVLPFLGDTELEVLSILGSFLLVVMHLVTALCTKERVVVANKAAKKSFRKELSDLWYNARNLPSIIRQICMIQFFAWIGWFPVLFYTTEFIAELHKRVHPDSADDPSLNAEATRLGSRAMFYSSILSLASNVVLPFFVCEAASSRKLLERTLNESKSRWAKMYERIKIHLAMLWAVSHLIFAGCMAATFFYSSVWGATIFTTLTGFSWSITQWAPFSLLAEAILTENAPGDDTGSIMLNDTRRRSRDLTADAEEHERQFLVASGEGSRDSDDDSGLEAEVQSFRSSASMDGQEHDEIQELRGEIMSNLSAQTSHLHVPTVAHSEPDRAPREHSGGLAAKAGVIIGIHNIFIVMPQFIMTGIASIVLALADGGSADDRSHAIEAGNGTSTPADLPQGSDLLLRDDAAAAGRPNSYAIVFRLGGLAAAVAFVLTVRLAHELRRR